MWQAWHFTCQKSFCVTFAILLNLHRFLKMPSIFRGARSTLDIILILRGGRSDLWHCIFLQITLSGLRQVVTTGKLRGRRCILCHVMKIDRCFARNIDFEAADFGLHSEKKKQEKQQEQEQK